MIFKPELARKVLDGSKTMTRRRGDFSYSPGREYKVQPGRSKFHVCHVLVTRVREERLGDISLGDAWAEGFQRVSAFMDYWTAINGGFDQDERVAVIEWDTSTIKECCARVEGAAASKGID